MTLPRYAFVVAALAALALTGCGEKKETLGDATAVYGPGVEAEPPPWEPEYANLKARIKQLGLPEVGKEQYHKHALLHVYNDGLLVEIPANIGIDPSSKTYASLHTHDPSGIVHMESERPHKFTLGDFFAIWGVQFGSRSLGALENEGEKQVRVYVNGKPIENPAEYVMQDNDNISVGYGTADSFPHEPDAGPLKTVAGKGGKQASCSKADSKGADRKSCVKPDSGD